MLALLPYVNGEGARAATIIDEQLKSGNQRSQNAGCFVGPEGLCAGGASAYRRRTPDPLVMSQLDEEEFLDNLIIFATCFEAVSNPICKFHRLVKLVLLPDYQLHLGTSIGGRSAL
jgi:hypothetical protein